MKKVYFAHPINTYGTPLEVELLALVKEKWPHHEVVNPSDQVHIDKVAELKKDDPKANVMPYFEALTASCDELVALPFADNMWGAGVWAEAEKMLAKGGWVWVIHPDSRKVTYVPKLLPELKLSVDETRARIRNPDGTSKPYA
ncbi:MAG: hypothetical protein A3C93_03450 [Candidatus Lloydbacteria bacterium RIFCSPHIGHO2_02_FULL_54_17]|uniref:Uncharacterized protein n=1 Tax=Candidatus Lloydbacteria bacterium RIFCSPHIGHO2_02_FULL_54_17 TaxID=1798664 RepID=A0A1G2DFX8_9BACT|nr:MAG: hypothetical protein A2762_01085 [Candidatus Lloydbacteria bacterium RIFCSPHIGHO2_01_FULL_54_11]OGZ12342.1 MAG: hypothetical protein A3C93_03450 [Candidatus Lloydbacteria bacterium RIFCSPHIGHO2_02_FULL_54_17]OGZ14487.1 MAG: hypothetical protein A3H76_06010 [Candidatus Lloydbacteria bacterium RIFCSPLOWO2_02_FULL_54_12]OGZ14565.1 MAG: hypothetical protein A2948_05670 [Candidatus Lloydbacteria bacterium RIFCSPLOWO2_01_FULL_54_18]